MEAAPAQLCEGRVVNLDEARTARMADRKPFLLRLDPETHRALQRWAADDCAP